MKNRIDCDFNTSNQIKSGMQSVNVIDNKIVSETKLNVIDKTRSAVDAKFGNQIDITTRIDSEFNRLSIPLLKEIDNKLNIFETNYDEKIENRLDIFEQHIDETIDENVNSKLTLFKEQVISEVEEDVDSRLNIFESEINQKFVPLRLNSLGSLDIRGQTIIPNKAYTYIDIKLSNDDQLSTRLDLADIIQTNIVTEDINSDTILRQYDYIFTKLIKEGEN